MIWLNATDRTSYEIEKMDHSIHSHLNLEVQLQLQLHLYLHLHLHL